MSALVARALKDEDFRQALVQDPAATAQAAGFNLSAAEVEAIRSVDPNLSQEELEERVSKFWWARPSQGIGGFEA